jgi:DNA-binding transcriptional MerR regulator
MRVLTMSELEHASGIPRSTIHFYLSRGLLPEPQKTASNRALYSDEHLALLERIRVAKESGLSLDEIRAELEGKVKLLNERPVDLEAEEYARVHRAILDSAMKELLEKGYAQTRMEDLIPELGINASIFYAHFPSKRDLLMECFSALVITSVDTIEPRIAESRDVVERVLARIAARFAIYPLRSDVLALTSGERLDGENEVRAAVEKAWDAVMQVISGELAGMRPPGVVSPPVPLVLLAYSLDEALQGTITRSRGDFRFSVADVIRTHVWLWLALRAAISGQVDVNNELAGYEELIQQMATSPPPVFSLLEEKTAGSSLPEEPPRL